jgi:hypothetical protein
MAHNEDNDLDDNDDQYSPHRTTPQMPPSSSNSFHLINMVHLMMVVQHT